MKKVSDSVIIQGNRKIFNLRVPSGKLKTKQN